MLITISVLILIICAILALFVLAQNPKGGGLAAGFTGAQQIGGVQRTADFLEKGTWTMAISLMVLCLAAAGVQKGGGSSLDEFDAPSTTIAPGSDFDPNAVNAAEEGQGQGQAEGQEATQ